MSSREKAFHKSWFLKINDPAQQNALWIRFSFLSSINGFKKVGDVWGIFFQKNSKNEVRKIVLKQSLELYDMPIHSGENPRQIEIGDHRISESVSQGVLQSTRGSKLKWDLTFSKSVTETHPVFPQAFSRLRMMNHTTFSTGQNFLATGNITLQGEEKVAWTNVPGFRGYYSGSRLFHSWLWGQCHTFVNEKGNPAKFQFEGYRYRLKLGPLPSPPFVSLFFHYRGQSYCFTDLKEIFYLRSKNTLNEWTFRADRGALSFHGRAKAEHKDLSGCTYEDTDGSLLYSTLTCLAHLEIHVYRNGKLEAGFLSAGTTALEWVSREKNPYVDISV